MTTYYVNAETGNNTNNGQSPTCAWKTISQAASTLVAGDICEIASGVYRETIIPTHSGTADNPITYRAAEGATVVVSGLEVATGTWQVYHNEISKLAIASPLALGNNQLFANGEMMVEARYPNIATEINLKRSDYLLADTGAYLTALGNNWYRGKYSHSSLASFPTDFWAGGFINFIPGLEWGGQTGEIESNSGTEITFKFQASSTPSEVESPATGDPFFLWGKLGALDSEKEFFWDTTAGILYFKPPFGMDLAHTQIEYRVRDLLLDLTNKSHLVFAGIEFIGGRIVSQPSSSYITLRRIRSAYGTHSLKTTKQYNSPFAVKISGTGSQLLDSLIERASGQAIFLSGKNHTIKNNVIRDNGYAGAGAGTIQTLSIYDSQNDPTQNLLFTQNTVFNCSSSAVAPASYNSVYSYNDLYNTGFQYADLYVMNAFNTGDVGGSEIAYNLAHDNQATAIPPQNGGGGIRLDSGYSARGCSNWKVHHNIVWNTTGKSSISIYGLASGHQNHNVSTGNVVVNNFCDQQLSVTNHANCTFLNGTVVKNNLALGDIPNIAGAVFSNNMAKALVHNIKDFDKRDFRLRKTSLAVNGGIEVSPYTNNYSGSAPTIGAIEFSQVPWIAGATILEEDVADLQVEFQQSGEGTLTAKIFNLPEGRKIPNNLQLWVGDQVNLDCWINHYDYQTHTGFAIAELSFGNQAGVVSVQLQLGASGVRVNKGTISLEKLVGSDITLDSESLKAETTLKEYSSVSPKLYQRTITVSNNSGEVLRDYPVRVVADLTTALKEGKVGSNLEGVSFRDEEGHSLPFWVLNPENLGSGSVEFWVNLPYIPLENSTFECVYGDTTVTSIENGESTFPAFFYNCDKGWFGIANHSKIKPLGNTSGTLQRNQISWSEANHKITVTGTTSSADISPNLLGFAIQSGVVTYPTSFAVDSVITVSTNVGRWRLTHGGYHGVGRQRIYETSPTFKRVEYWDRTTYILGTSNLDYRANLSKNLSFAWTETGQIVRWFEEGTQVASRTGFAIANQRGHWNIELEVAETTFEFSVSKIRVRPLPASGVEPTTSVGGEMPLLTGLTQKIALQ